VAETGIDDMRWSDVNFRREAWWLLLLGAVVPLGLLAASLLWTQ
jgi:hypothetical protein